MNTKESVLRKEYPAEEGLRPEGAIKDRYSISWPQKGISSRRRIKTHAPGPVCMLLLLRKEYPAEEGLRPMPRVQYVCYFFSERNIQQKKD